MTANLYSALKHLRLPDRARLFWIDAISINQNDIREKDRQVQRMGEVYAWAKKVIVWLGEKSEDSDEAIDFCEIIDGLLPLATKASSPTPAGTVDQIEDQLPDSMVPEQFTTAYQKSWQSVYNIFLRPWWNRAWVVQEFVQGRDVEFQVGLKRIHRHKMAAALRCFQSAFLPNGQITLGVEINEQILTNAWSFYTIPKNNKYNPAFHRTLWDQKAKLCLNPVDKIFSLLSLTHENIQNFLKVDYRASVEDVYCKSVRACIREDRSLEVLCCAMAGEKKIKSLPSWCPDWSCEASFTVLSGYIEVPPIVTMPAHFDFDEIVLSFFGCSLVDVVADVQVQQVDEGFGYNGESPTWDLHNMAITLNETRKRPPGEWLQIVFRTLVGGYLESTDGRINIGPKIDMTEDLFMTQQWPKDRDLFLREGKKRTQGRTIILSKKGCLGLAPRATRVGDCGFIFEACSAPAILRKGSDGVFEWIGTAFVDSIMEISDKAKSVSIDVR